MSDSSAAGRSQSSATNRKEPTAALLSALNTRELCFKIQSILVLSTRRALRRRELFASCTVLNCSSLTTRKDGL
jgi:hypothetical protein